MKTRTPSELLTEILTLREQVQAEGQQIFNHWRTDIHRRAFLISSFNLASYLAFRQRDLRDLQAELIPLGLSSLGRCEARVMPNLDAVAATLRAISGQPPREGERPSPRSFYRGERMLAFNADKALGVAPAHRRVRIMVTLPSEAAENPELIHDLIAKGATWLRINCAHDDAAIWGQMIAHIRAANRELKQPCRVLMDLGGPKIRTGEVWLKDHHERLHVGDAFLLTKDVPKATKDLQFAVQCLVPEILDQVELKQRVWMDDGHLGGVIESRREEGLVIRVTHCREKGLKLRPEKGLNFPDTEVTLAALTDKDREDLAFVAANADAVGYSFVQSAQDIATLQAELRKYPTAATMTIVAKIETLLAVQNLPEIILQAASYQPFAVMIARGDLAVEIGYQRLAEIQEQLLWICEAAHIPVIWATQVLENFVKEGIPSRAEMTDAAMGERAECVMLNKGPHILEAVAILDDVLTRMQTHQLKKTPQLRALRSYDAVIARALRADD